MGMAAAAHANGAFPDSQALFAPEDQPGRLLLTTNFGVVVTQDEGQTWNIMCEVATCGVQGCNAFLYQMGPAPDHRLLSVSYTGLSFSDDNGCGWQFTDGGLGQANVQDAVVDPTDGAHVLVIARPFSTDGGLMPEGIFESHTGGLTFAPVPLYSAPPNAFITGVEVARSQPATYYATMFISQPTYRPFVLRSDDQGVTWVSNELTASIGADQLLLMAVDPQDATKSYLRLIDGLGSEALALATDGGAQASVSLSLDAGAFLSAFLRREDGSLVACQRGFNGGSPGCFRSTDNGGTFSSFLPAFHIRALAERDGGLYLAGDNYNDGFAVGALQPDGGVEPLLHFNGICGLVQCGNIPTLCAPWWVTQQNILAIPPSVCGHSAPDAGPAPDGGGPTPPPSKKGCGCATGAPSALALLGLLLLSAHTRGRKATLP